MKVQVDLNPRDLWRLEERAEHEGVTLSAYLSDLIASRERPGVSTPDRVRDLWREGLCDADISVRVKCRPGYVAVVRRSLGLPANRRFVKAGK